MEKTNFCSDTQKTRDIPGFPYLTTGLPGLLLAFFLSSFHLDNINDILFSDQKRSELLFLQNLISYSPYRTQPQPPDLYVIR